MMGSSCDVIQSWIQDQRLLYPPCGPSSPTWWGHVSWNNLQPKGYLGKISTTWNPLFSSWPKSQKTLLPSAALSLKACSESGEGQGPRHPPHPRGQSGRTAWGEMLVRGALGSNLNWGCNWAAVESPSQWQVPRLQKWNKYSPAALTKNITTHLV